MLKKLIFIFVYLIANASLHAAATAQNPILKAKTELDKRCAFYRAEHKKIEGIAAIVKAAVTTAEVSGSLNTTPSLKTKIMRLVSLIQSLQSSLTKLVEKADLAQKAMHFLIKEPSKAAAATYNKAWAECVVIVENLKPQFSEAEFAKAELGKILDITSLLAAAAA